MSNTETSKLSMYDFLVAVESNNITAEVVAKATAEKVKIEEERKKQAEKRAEKAKEDNPLKERISDFLSSGANFASAVGMELGVSTSKASYLLRDMENEGYLTSVMAKAPGMKSKSKQYTLVKPFSADEQ